jgi:hypothetical protein
MYASLGTRPDIAFAVQTVSRFATNPGMAHWDAVKRIFHYLKGSREFWLCYRGDGRILEGYADADGSMMEDRHAISGYLRLRIHYQRRGHIMEHEKAGNCFTVNN